MFVNNHISLFGLIERIVYHKHSKYEDQLIHHFDFFETDEDRIDFEFVTSSSCNNQASHKVQHPKSDDNNS